MSCFLGIDTSNYTTSVALANDEGVVILNKKIPLPVACGERGLRQSDAVFAQIKNLPEALEAVRGSDIAAVGVSAFPRDVEGSYMPCFLSGIVAAESASCALDVPLYRFSHQRGHIRAALYSSGREDLVGKRYAAFHVSGGTTEILFVDSGKIELIGETLDLNAGQAIDRSGVLMGMKFPCGREMSDYALKGEPPEHPKISVNGLTCNLSGVENKVKSFLAAGYSAEDVSAYVIEFVKMTLDKLCENLLAVYPETEIVFSGGVTSNRYIADHLGKKYGAFFAAPEFSADNACGTALLTFDRFGKETKIG